MWEDLAFALSAAGFVAATALLLVELRHVASRLVHGRHHYGPW
jgi:hypothetical protein